MKLFSFSSCWLRFRINLTQAKLNRAHRLTSHIIADLNEADRIVADVTDELEFLKKKLTRKESKNVKVVQST